MSPCAVCVTAGFHLCVLIVHLSEHLPQEKRLNQFKTSLQVPMHVSYCELTCLLNRIEITRTL